MKKLVPPEKGVFAARTRFLLLVLVVLCLAINWANILTFNFTVICMTPKENTSLLNASSTLPLSSIRTTEFSNTEKSQAMAVVAAGALVANIPIVTLINWYGPRHLFTVVGLFGAFATAIVPWAMNMGFYWFLGVRVLQGIAFAGDMATFGHFVTPFVRLFNRMARNDPNKHPFVNDVEKSKIARGRDTPDADAQKCVPYREILTSSAAWAVFIGAVGNFAGINLLFQFTPTYLNKVQGFQVMKTGFMAALPPLLQAVCKELSGLSNDRIPKRWMEETVKTRVYNTFAFLTMAASLVILSFVPPGSGLTALAIIVGGATLLGFNTGGFYKSGSLIAGPYAPFVLGQVSTAMTITMLLVPLIVNPLTPDNTQEQWALAFYAIAAIMIICNIYYVIYAKGKPCYWATAKYYRERMEKKKESSRNSNKVHCVEDSNNNSKTANGDSTHPPSVAA